MLTRRRNYAITHLSQGGHSMPHVSAGGLGKSPHRTTKAGAGRQVGNFPDTHAAMKAGAADASSFTKHHADIWKRLATNADDPDSALGDKDHLTAVETSLGVASHHITMNEKWLRTMLDEALHVGVRDDAVRVLEHAGLGHRAKVAFGHLGLTEMVQQQHKIPAPRPPHEAMIAPAADDPHAAVELYSRHPEAVHRALEIHPGSEALARLVGRATSGTDADPALVRANAERLTRFHAARPTGTGTGTPA
jgi:hypothetical protein